MDSLEIEGKEYISAKVAARDHSYTMDYIGQLIRGGKLIGKKVGRAWYVEKDSLKAYLALLLEPKTLRSEVPPDSPETVPESQKLEQEVGEMIEEGVAGESADVQTAPMQTVATSEEITAKEEAMKEVSTDAPPAYHYPMLNYVREEEKSEELLPILEHTEAVIEQKIPIHRSYDSTPVIKTESRPDDYRQVVHTQAWEEESRQHANIGPQVSYLPAKRRALTARLPVVVGSGATALLLLLLGVSMFLTRTVLISYKDGVASVTSGIEYESVFNKSR